MALAENITPHDGISLAVILSDNTQVYRSVADTFITRLDRQSQKRHQITLLSPKDLTSQNKGSYDLLVAIGTTASRITVIQDRNTPTLCVFIPRKNFKELPVTPQQDVASIVIDQPLTRYLKLTTAIFGRGDRRLGFFYNGQKQARDLILNLIGEEHFTPVLEAIDSPITARNIIRLLDSSDVIQLLPGISEIPPQRARWLLYMAYRERVPVIAFSESYVKSGALAAISTSPDAIGRQAADYVLHVLGAPGAITLQHEPFGRINYPTTFSIYINHKIADFLGIDVADPDILKQRIDKAVSVETNGSTHAD